MNKLKVIQIDTSILFRQMEITLKHATNRIMQAHSYGHKSCTFKTYLVYTSIIE